MGDAQLVWLVAPGKDAKWVKVGESFHEYRLVRLDTAADLLYLQGAAQGEIAVKLARARVKLGGASQAPVRLPVPRTPSPRSGPVPLNETYSVFPANEIQRSEAGLDWDWIESERNPMRRAPIQPSIAEQEQWPHLSEAEKGELVELYRQCGWHITISHRSSGVGLSYVKIKREQGGG